MASKSGEIGVRSRRGSFCHATTAKPSLHWQETGGRQSLLLDLSHRSFIFERILIRVLFPLCPRKYWEKEKERFMSLNNCFTSSSAYIQKTSFFFLLRIDLILAENPHHMPGCTIFSKPCKIFPLLNGIFHSKTCVYTVESSLFGSKEGKGTGYKNGGW